MNSLFSNFKSIKASKIFFFILFTALALILIPEFAFASPPVPPSTPGPSSFQAIFNATCDINWVLTNGYGALLIIIATISAIIAAAVGNYRLFTGILFLGFMFTMHPVLMSVFFFDPNTQCNAANGWTAPTSPLGDPFNLLTCIIIENFDGATGALIMAGAGIVSVIAAATGAYRAMIATGVVGISAFIIKSFLLLNFHDPATLALANNPNECGTIYTNPMVQGAICAPPVGSGTTTSNSAVGRNLGCP